MINKIFFLNNSFLELFNKLFNNKKFIRFSLKYYLFKLYIYKKKFLLTYNISEADSSICNKFSNNLILNIVLFLFYIRV